MRGAVAHTTAVLYPLSNPQRVWHGASAIYAPADPPPPPLFAPCPATSFGALRAGEILDPPPGWNAVLCDHWYLPATLLTTLPLSTTQTPLMYSPRAPPHSMASPCFQAKYSAAAVRAVNDGTTHWYARRRDRGASDGMQPGTNAIWGTFIDRERRRCKKADIHHITTHLDWVEYAATSGATAAETWASGSGKGACPGCIEVNKDLYAPGRWTGQHAAAPLCFHCFRAGENGLDVLSDMLNLKVSPPTPPPTIRFKCSSQLPDATNVTSFFITVRVSMAHWWCHLTTPSGKMSNNR